MIGHQLFIDIQTIQSQLFAERGIPRYTADFSRSLLRAGAPVAGLALHPLLPHPTGLHRDLAEAPQLCWNTARAFHRAAEAGPVAYHIMSPLEGPRPVQATLPPYALGNGVPLVITVYDLIPEIFKVFPPGSPWERVYLLRKELMRRADLLVAISESTRNDAMELLGVDADRIAVIGAATSPFFRPPADGETPKDLVRSAVPGITRPFVHTVTGVFGLDKRKNTEILIEAFGLLPRSVRESHQLVVTCKMTEHDAAAWHALAREQGLGPDDLVLTDFVPDAVLRALYQTAALFAYPSVYEGFGLPALEAARCGCPTITSNTSSMPEILDFAPATFSPTDREELAALLERALTDGGFREKLGQVALAASAKHTWERVAERAIDAYGRLDAPPPPVRRRARPTLRLALVGPLPPAPSGVANFNLDLAAALSEHAAVDCIVEGESGAGQDRDRGYRRFPAKAFGSVLSPASYDSIVYSFANTRHHTYTYELAMWTPGIAWLHDVSLAEMFLSYARKRMDPDAVRNFMYGLLQQHYRERTPMKVLDEGSWQSPMAYDRYGARLASDVALRSRHVIVGSDVARSLLEFDAGPYSRLPAISVIPPASTLGACATGGGAVQGAPLVVALGSVLPAKRPETLLEAVAGVATRRTDLRVALVGDVEPSYRDELLRRAGELGIADRVEITGFVDRHEYGSWARRATCAVLLGTGAAAGSLVLADALACGVPTITNLSGAARLRADTVIRVAPEAGAGVLAAEIESILDDPTRRDGLRESALAQGRSRTMSDVVEQLLEVVRLDATAPTK